MQSSEINRGTWYRYVLDKQGGELLYGHYLRRYFQHAHSISIVGVGKRGAY